MAAPSPAFTSVSARRSLGRPDAHPPLQPTNPSPAPKKMDWPQSVRNYVQRAFAPENSIKGIERTEMESKLKEIISAAAERNSLNAIDWDIFPLPQNIVQTEKAAQYSASTAAWQNAQVHASYPPPPDHYNPSQSDPHATDNKGSSKKRKSMEVRDEESTPPWRKQNKQNGFGDRVTYANKHQADQIDKRRRRMDDDQKSSKYQAEPADLEKRKKRFANGKPGNRSPPTWSNHNNLSSPVPASGPVVGTCQDIEKEYLRLTAAPKPETVRPPEVLKITLQHLRNRANQGAAYNYLNSQFKSLRQDLTVQHVKTEFTVQVYEVHAKVALNAGDLGEYNQCQTQLRALYSQKLGGHPDEFLAYRILYFIYTCNRAGLSDLLAELTPADKAAPPVKHALDLRSALALGNYHKFFKLADETPNFGDGLINMFKSRERIAAMTNICKAYMNVDLRFLTDELRFGSEDECRQFLEEANVHTLIQQSNSDNRSIFPAKQAFSTFEELRRAAFKRIDIKGQM